jgi:hypothetical protein
LDGIEMKLFQRNRYNQDNQIRDHFQFLIIKNFSLLHIIYWVDNPCPYTGIRIITEFLSTGSLFGIDFQVKGYSLGFWLFTEYWND